MTPPKKASPVPFPPVFFPAGETDPFLAKFKASLSKRLSLSRMETLYEEVDLAVYLTAKHRETEALEVASFLPAHLVFSGNYNLWSPVASALTVATFLLGRAGEAATASALRARLREHPAHANRERAYYRDELENALPTQLDKGWADSSKKWACHLLARGCAKAIFWRETNHPGFHHHGFYDNAVVDRLIALGLERLSDRMGA
jgi:hypothetical protein